MYLTYYVRLVGIEKKCIVITVQRDATKISLFIILQVLFYIFRVSTTPIIRSTQNCNYSLRYLSDFLRSYLPPTWPTIIRSTQNCNYSLRYLWDFLRSYLPPTWPTIISSTQTVTKASGTGQFFFCAATSLQRGQGSLATLDWPRVYVYESTEDVFTVLVWQMELIARRSVMSILAYVGIWSDRDKEGRRWKEFIANFQSSFSATNYRFSKCTKYCFMMALALVSELV